MSDIKEILGGERADAPVAETTDTSPVTETAPVETTEKPEAQAEQHHSDDGKPTAPVAAITEERRKYKEHLAAVERRLEESNRQMQQMQAILLQQQQAALQAQQPQTPQIPEEEKYWEDPIGFTKAQVEAVKREYDQRMTAERDMRSRREAEKEYGKEVVDKAFADLKALEQRDPSVLQAIVNQLQKSDQPYMALVDWHKRAMIMSEVGNDPIAYREKLEAELRAKLQGEISPQAQVQPAPGVMPSNFATARNVGTRAGPAWSGPDSIADIFARR